MMHAAILLKVRKVAQSRKNITDRKCSEAKEKGKVHAENHNQYGNM